MIVKIGNPFNRNHFLRSSQNKKYHKIIVDWETALADKYKTSKIRGDNYKEHIEEMREFPSFNILYECKFPDADGVDREGWQPLLTESEIENAQVDEMDGFGAKITGVDVGEGRGGDYSVIADRWANYAEVVMSTNNIDQMAFAGHIMNHLGSDDGSLTWIDKTGSGDGVYTRLREQGKNVNPFIAAAKPLFSERFRDLKMEASWRFREWIKSGGKLKRNKCWNEIGNIKWKVSESTGRSEIMSKQVMRSKGLDSPDEVDSVIMTFARPDINPKLREYRQRKKEERRKRISTTANKGGSPNMRQY